MSAKQPAMQAPALPQVNLLPPEVKAARGLARTKRWLALAVVLALVVSAGMVGKTMLDQDAADEALAQAQARTAELQAEQARYAQVPLVLAAVDRAENARAIGMSTEVMWRQYFQALAWSAPPGVRIENLKIVSATPMVLPQAPADALSAQGVSAIAFTAQSATIIDTETWLRNLAQIPGFSDPWFSQAQLSEAGGAPIYNVTAAVILTADAYELRFSPEALAAADEDATAEEEE